MLGIAPYDLQHAPAAAGGDEEVAIENAVGRLPIWRMNHHAVDHASADCA
jgi:hypothetical protein